MMLVLLIAAQWSIGPQVTEDTQTQYRVFDVQASKTVAWVNGWDQAVRVSACPNVEAALRSIISDNPVLQGAADGLAALTLIDQRLALPPPFMSNDGARVPPAEWILDGQGGRWTMKGQSVLRNGEAIGAWGSVVALRSGSIYHRGTNGVWLRWTGTAWTAAPIGFEP